MSLLWWCCGDGGFAWRGLSRIPDAGFALVWVGLVLLVRGGGCGLVVC